MDNRPHTSFLYQDRSNANVVKKEIRKIAESVSFSPLKLAHIDILISELTTNLTKHAPAGGEFLVKHFVDDGRDGLEILCIDNGPGIDDLPRMLQDGVSTSGTLGHGLGALKRLSDHFEIYTKKDWGTIVLCRIFRNEAPLRVLQKVAIGAILVPYKGESLCGDGWAYKTCGSILKVLITDGLGHGKEAFFASQQAIRYFMNSDEISPSDMLRGIHESIRLSRGVVATCINVDLTTLKGTMCGIGNISGRVLGFLSTRVFLSYNGIVGHNIPARLMDREIDVSNGLLVLCSDGLKDRWDLASHPMLSRYDISIAAAVIYKENNRRSDDVSVLLLKIKL